MELLPQEASVQLEAAHRVLESLAPQAAHLLSQLPLLGSSRWAGEQRTELSKLETGTVRRCQQALGVLAPSKEGSGRANRQMPPVAQNARVPLRRPVLRRVPAQRRPFSRQACPTENPGSDLRR